MILKLKGSEWKVLAPKLSKGWWISTLIFRTLYLLLPQTQWSSSSFLFKCQFSSSSYFIRLRDFLPIAHIYHWFFLGFYIELGDFIIQFSWFFFYVAHWVRKFFLLNYKTKHTSIGSMFNKTHTKKEGNGIVKVIRSIIMWLSNLFLSTSFLSISSLLAKILSSSLFSINLFFLHQIYTKRFFLVFAPAFSKQKSYTSAKLLQIKQLFEHKLQDFFQINALPN